MALERIQRDPGILSNYSLELLVKDTQCRTDLTLNAYIDFVSQQSNQTFVGILGPACSIQAEIVAEVSHYHNIIVMGYSVEAVSLADRKKYPLFFRTSSSYFEFKRAYASLFKSLDWKQYATLTEANYASSIVTGVHEHLAKLGVQLVYSRLIVIQNTVDIETYLRTLKDSTARVIIGNLFSSVARAVICEAYKQVCCLLGRCGNISDTSPGRGSKTLLLQHHNITTITVTVSTISFCHNHYYHHLYHHYTIQSPLISSPPSLYDTITITITCTIT